MGDPVEPELQMPEWWGAVTSGSTSVDSARLLLEQVGGAGVDGHRRTDDGPQPAQLPLGQVPAHGDRDGPQLPGGEGGEHQLGRVLQLHGEQVAHAEAAPGQGPGHLRGPVVELGPCEVTLAPVLGREDQGDLVRRGQGQLMDPGPVGGRLRLDFCFGCGFHGQHSYRVGPGVPTGGSPVVAPDPFAALSMSSCRTARLEILAVDPLGKSSTTATMRGFL